MSIKTNLIPGTTLTEQVLNSAADSAIRGFKDEAIKEFEESGLNKEQMLKVTEIIKTVNSDGSIAELANLKDRILDNLTKQSTPETVVPQKTEGVNCIVSNADESMLPDNQWFGCFTDLPNDMVTTIFMMCFHTGGPKGTQILAMTCKHLYQKIIGPKGFVEQFSLEQLCPRLTILDLDQKNVLKSAKYNKLQILNACDKLLSQEILGNQGLTLIYMPQGGLTLVNLLNQATKEKVVMEVGRGKMKDFEGIGYFDSSQKPPYLVLIMNGLFSESFDNTGLGNYEALCALVKEIGCELPRLEELLALHIFSPQLVQVVREVAFWRSSSTFHPGRLFPWGIEHYQSLNNTIIIRICNDSDALWISHGCQGVIRFSPSKK